MFRIRRIFDNILPRDKKAISQVQTILKEQFPLIDKDEIKKLPLQLKDPLQFQYRTTLFIAESSAGTVTGFALLLYFPDLHFCYLDYVSAAKFQTGRGIGGALYESVREEARAFNSLGIFMECLPDDPALCKDELMLKQNKSRLKFYEYYGATPIVNTLYETPVKPGDDNPPYLVFDDLGSGNRINRKTARQIVAAILNRKYPDLCSKEYNAKIIDSFKDEYITLRELKYLKKKTKSLNHPVNVQADLSKTIKLFVSEQHAIHHVRERGYVESPVRIKSILKELDKMECIEKCKVKHFSEKYIESVHSKEFISYFKKVCELLEPGKSVYPYVFPIRNQTRSPKELPMRAGYYCIDTFTPLNKNAFIAARSAVDCALSAAEAVCEGARLTYALVRPPGHHAETRSFGGFCYFNSTAIAAQFLSKTAKVAILDIDYHHGNGQQEIFYSRKDVLTVSVHAHPRVAYPFFSGFEDEQGKGAGKGYNINYPLAEKISPEKYLYTVSHAVKKISEFDPLAVIIALGLDTAKGDPTGTWDLQKTHFGQLGSLIASIKKPLVVVQEGGYLTRSLGKNAKAFFKALCSG
jgi:acetoin utilization deacetylase AcuC-like enzyme/GNAT superfamily N-acetyltransferase